MFVAKRALIITREVKFSMDARSGLERYGYEVTAFTNSRPALDFLRQNAQHVALLDFRVNDMPATDVLDHMRAMQHDIAVIASPEHPAVQALKERYNIQAIITLPYPTRKLLDLFEAAVRQMYDAQPDTTSSPVMDNTDTARMGKVAESIEFWITDTDDGDTIVEMAQPVEEPVREELATRNFTRLAQEEPPMPTFEDNSTVRDLREHLNRPENIRRIVEALDDDTTPGREKTESSPEESRSIPAAMILETALDQSTPVREFSVAEFMNRVRERGDKDILPLPSWIDESERYVREPEFLAGDLPVFTASLDYTATKTTPSEAQAKQVEMDPASLVTDKLEPIHRSRPVIDTPPVTEPAASLGEIAPQQDEHQLVPEHTPELTADVAEDVIIPAQIAYEQPPLRAAVETDLEPEQSAVMPYTHYDQDDPYVAQLALTLTQVSLELIAEATLLAKGGEIVAYAGRLPRVDIEELRAQLADDWSAIGQKSRIRFVTLQGSGADYMLYTRKTDGEFSLSMIFAGTMPLTVIRRQGKRLADALAAVPEILTEPEEAPEAVSAKPIRFPTLEEIGERAPYAFLWVLANPQAEIPENVANEIIRRLDIQLSQGGWKISNIRVDQDYVFLYADMPANLEAQRMVRNLMHVSGDIVQDMFPALEGESLWSDSYLILQPGREMNAEEIQRFISFSRR